MRTFVVYAMLTMLALAMVYPILWLVSASFKPNSDIFTTSNLIPNPPVFTSFINGWDPPGLYTYTTYFLNTFKLVVPTVLFTVISSLIVAYGFARFKFRFKNVLYIVMLSSLMLPDEVTLIPKYIFFNQLAWSDSYLPIIVPSMFATYSFFIFMLVQFIRGLPAELDNAARIDGCNSFGILVRIILPLSVPALVCCTIFQFVWRWNDFLNVMVFINSNKLFPVSLALRMNLDTTDSVIWGNTLAMAVLALVPPTILFFVFQRYLVEGVATTGLKG